MAYQLEISPRGSKSIEDCFNYLLNQVGNFGSFQAAENFRNNLHAVYQRLKIAAQSYSLCEEPELRAFKQYKIHFPKMNYKVFYHINGNTVVIDLVCHDLQDYQRALLD